MKASACRLACIFALFALPAVAQFTAPDILNNAGSLPNQPYHGTDIESVNLATGNLTVDIPLLSYPQRGKLKLGFDVIYSNNTMQITDMTNPPPPPYVSFLLPSKYGGGGAHVVTTPSVGLSSTDGSYTMGTYNYSYIVWTLGEADGAQHVMGNMGTITTNGAPPNYTYIQNGPWRSLDGSGWL